LTSLQQLRLGGNQLTGTIPALPASLQQLDLSTNQLTGTIPDLSATANVDLSCNQLTSETGTSATDRDSDWATTQCFLSTPPVTGTVTTVVVEETNCPPKVKLEVGCDAKFQVVSNLEVTDKGVLAFAIVEGTLTNGGWVFNLHVKPNATVTGGTVTGRIENEGTMSDFIFRGSSIVGGTLAGTIVNLKARGVFQDVQLAADTTITGGLLLGEITGDCTSPAKLENMRILRGSHLSCVILGDGVVLEDGVTVDGVAETPDLPALGKTDATDAKGKSIEVKSELSGGVATPKNEGVYQIQATVKVAVDSVDVIGQITVDPAHVGQVADLFVYATYQETADSEAIYLMRDSNGGIFLWNQQVADLVPFQADVKLTAKQTLTLYKGVFLGKGVLNLFFGYRLKEGTVVQSGEPLMVTIE